MRRFLVAAVLPAFPILSLAVSTPPDGGIPGGSLEQPFDDARYSRIGRMARSEAFAAGHTFTRRDIESVLNRKEPLGLAPAAPLSRPLSDEEFHRRASLATLALFTISEKSQKAGTGASLGTAFLVGKGVAVTCFHALKGLGEPFAVVALTVNGEPVRVTKILAAYPKEDMAFLAVEGAGDNALPLRSDTPVGTRVRAMGHPLSKFYYTIEGSVCRYGLKSGTRSEDHAVRLNLVIDSIGGFSGGAVMDAAGNAVGMLDSFDTLQTGRTEYKVQSAIPAGMILAHFTRPYTGVMSADEIKRVLKESGASGEEQVYDIKSSCGDGFATAEMSSGDPAGFEMIVEDKDGREIARGKPSAALRAGLPPWAQTVYDASLAAAQAKLKSLLGPSAPAKCL